jgi:hypothetical protein
MELEEMEDLRERSLLSVVEGCGLRLLAVLAPSMNSQDGVLCNVLRGENGWIEATRDRFGGSWGAEVGLPRSGEEALVVPDQNEGTGLASGSVIAMDGRLPAENGPRSISLPAL